MNRVLQSTWTLRGGLALAVILGSLVAVQLPDALDRGNRASRASEIGGRLIRAEDAVEDVRAHIAERKVALRRLHSEIRQEKGQLAKKKAQLSVLRDQVKALESKIQKLSG